MIIRAELKYKQSEYGGEACVVDKIIELPNQRFKQFSRALLADYDFIAESKNSIQRDTDSRHCLLILDAEGMTTPPIGGSCCSNSPAHWRRRCASRRTSCGGTQRSTMKDTIPMST